PERSLTTLETVIVETPARRATSLIVTTSGSLFPGSTRHHDQQRTDSSRAAPRSCRCLPHRRRGTANPATGPRRSPAGRGRSGPDWAPLPGSVDAVRQVGRARRDENVLLSEHHPITHQGEQWGARTHEDR